MAMEWGVSSSAMVCVVIQRSVVPVGKPKHENEKSYDGNWRTLRIAV